MKAGNEQKKLGKLLDRHKSTISRKLIHNTDSWEYRPKQVCELSVERSQNSRNAPTVETWVRKEACSLLQMQLSPDQIAARLPISHGTLYRYFFTDKTEGVAIF